MLTIRLQRTGKKNQADFRIVLAEKKSPVNKKFTEVLGSYNPRKKNFQVKEDRVKYWIGQHVELSPTIHNLFVTKNLLQATKVKAFSTPKKAAEEKPADAASTAAAPAAGEETPAEAAEAVAEMESKVDPVVEEKPENTAKENTPAEAPVNPDQPAV
jgi:small subunit ribosomal protein S16